MEKPNFKTLCKMHIQQLTNFPFIEQDFDFITNYQFLCQVIDHLNEVIENSNTQNDAITELYNAFVELKDYVDNLDLQEEVNNKLDEMASDGTLDTLIGKYILNMPRGNEMSLQRFGRKLVFGENSNAYNYNQNGKACTLQGGCMLDENIVAYALWDSENINLNKNTIVIMNIKTGTIQRQEDFVFGWCNSLAYDGENLYVAVRGTTTDNVSTNNGIIKIINPLSLEVIDELDLQINVNAISIYNEKIYALEENTNKIKLFTLDGQPLNQTINLNVNINNIYNQDIKVTKYYIYIISTRPNNLLNVYDLNGNNVETYNVKKYGGMYFVGELQFIDTIENNDMVLGSTVASFNEHNNQFFKFNLVNNISTNDVVTILGQTLYCDSSKNIYNPDGSQENPFTTITECGNTNVKSIVCDANNKEYDYVYLSNNHKFRLQNAILNYGGHLQYGDYYLDNCTIKRALNDNTNACIYFRYCDVYFDNCTFDATDCDYCVYPGDNNLIKFISPTFENYNIEVFRTTAPGCIIGINNLNNQPYIPRVYDHEYNLFDNGQASQYKTGLLEYNTSRSQADIQKIINNCERVVIGYQALNTACIKEVTISKTSNNTYTLVDETSSSSTFNIRIAKMIMTITSAGVNVTSSNVSKIVASDSSTAAFTITQAADSSTAEDFIILKYVKFKH